MLILHNNVYYPTSPIMQSSKNEVAFTTLIFNFLKESDKEICN